jgi:hypothetical protein
MKFSRIISITLKTVLVAFTCALMILNSAFPALAMESSRSNPSAGEAPLDRIFEKSEEVTKADPLSMEETQRRANEGINEIQGAADKDQMYRPENSNATTPKQQFQNALEKVTGKD